MALQAVLNGLSSSASSTLILEPMTIIASTASSSALSVAQLGNGNIAEFKSASTTLLVIRDNTVMLADNIALAFGEGEMTFAYNSATGRVEVLGSERDLYIGLGAGR